MAMSKYKDKDGGVLLSFNGVWVSWLHTITAYTAFISALIVGTSLHYHKIVENAWFGYPQEWFPSVSATIGDRYPERSCFQLFIALASGPRFALVGFWYLMSRRPGTKLPGFVAFWGVFRSLTCGGWTYVTSTDDHDWHDVFMISYLLATIPWTFGCLALSPPNPVAIKYRKYAAGAFYGSIIPLIYFFIRHKVHRVPGAYTTYAFFEWALVLLDLAFDAVTALDFDSFEVVIRDVKGISKGANHSSVSSAELEKEKERMTAGVFTRPFGTNEAIDIVADIYHGFVFWSILTSLGVLVWYFPLWYMGISGFEAFVMSTISPVLLGIPAFRRLVLRNLRVVHLLSLTGLLAYLVTDPVLRLTTVGFAVSMQCLAWSGTLYSESVHEGRLESRVLALVSGLLMSTIVKFIWQTNNPIWPIMHAENGGWNLTGLLLAVPAALRFTRRGALNSGSADQIKDGSNVLAAMSLAGVLFGMHSLLSDSSTMILWVWDGYPIRGPTANTSAWYTIFAMTGGLVLGVFRPQLVSSYNFYAVGCVGATVLTFFHHWFGYLGGLVTATFLMAAAFPLISNASKKSPAVTFGLGFFLYNIMLLFHVWVVAYAFVPGGPLVREHTDWVMLTTWLLMGAGFLDMNNIKNSRRAGKRPMTASAPKPYRKYHLASLGVLNLLFLGAAFLRFPSNDYMPHHADQNLITAGIWTIHFSLDNDMWSSEVRMRDLIKEMELDVVGLLESDLQRVIMGNRDTTQYLAEDLGMYVDYGPGPNKHTWGAALLSKFPILNSTHHLLPSPVGELAPAIHATIEAYGQLVDVFVFHSGQEEDPEDRRLQTEYLSKLMGSVTNRPAILLSYLVTKPKQGNYNTYVSDISGMHDIDHTDWDRWCEYILYKGLKRTGYARVSRSTITDTELQVGKFVVPRAEEDKVQVQSLDEEARNKRVTEGEVGEGLRFPEMFKGKGKRGHAYHVFDAPRYFG
ncbi:unnamed protein product [Discula destructiva]